MKNIFIAFLLFLLCGCTSYGPWQKQTSIKNMYGEFSIYHRSQQPHICFIPMIVAIPDQTGVQLSNVQS